MSSLPLQRGKVFERQVARVLTKALRVKFERRLGASRDGGCDVGLPSTVDSPHAQWVIECKRTSKRELRTWWRQARAQAKSSCRPGGSIPVLVYQVGLRTPRRWVFGRDVAAFVVMSAIELLDVDGERVAVFTEDHALWYMHTACLKGMGYLVRRDAMPKANLPEAAD